MTADARTVAACVSAALDGFETQLRRRLQHLAESKSQPNDAVVISLLSNTLASVQQARNTK